MLSGGRRELSSCRSIITSITKAVAEWPPTGAAALIIGWQHHKRFQMVINRFFSVVGGERYTIDRKRQPRNESKLWENRLIGGKRSESHQFILLETLEIRFRLESGLQKLQLPDQTG